MGLFTRRRSEPERRAELERRITAAFAAHGATGDMVRDPDDPLNTALHVADGAMWGYGNLMLRLLEAPERTWDRAIEAHVAALLAPRETVDLATAAGRTALRARLFTAATPPVRDLAYALPWAPGIAEILCIDRPDTVQTVSDAEVAGLDLDELRAIGRRNLQAERIDERRELAPGIGLVSGSSLFVASRLLDPEFLDDLLRTAPRGLVVGIPDRHTLLHHAVTGPDSLEPITRLAALVGRIDRDQRPGGLLSPFLYHVTREGVQQVTDLTEDGGIAILAEGAFLAAIEE